ncbi:MAG TPA: SPASM domain-containing protein, partial [Thermoanaerobaculia bacterium]|nr:SPASM domain-containing protein [Thermoanaerobaculia bacterium]
VSLLRSRNVRLRLKTPLCSWNEHQIDAMIQLVESLGVSYNIDPHISPRDDGDTSPLHFRISTEARERIMRQQIESGALLNERTEGGANCGLGRTTLAVDPEGNVFPCLSWKHEALGNVREVRLRDLWQSSERRKSAAATSDAANEKLLQAGENIAPLPFCPATAARKTGTPLEFYDDFLQDLAMFETLKKDLPRLAAK